MSAVLPVALQSDIKCPACGHTEREMMPADACQCFYDCKGCAALLKPLPGDCCVFCSYGTVKCPPMHRSERGCCTRTRDCAAP